MLYCHNFEWIFKISTSKQRIWCRFVARALFLQDYALCRHASTYFKFTITSSLHNTEVLYDKLPVPIWQAMILNSLQHLQCVSNKNWLLFQDKPLRRMFEWMNECFNSWPRHAWEFLTVTFYAYAFCIIKWSIPIRTYSCKHNHD